jgi:undecaprenyl-diphosphatase
MKVLRAVIFSALLVQSSMTLFSQGADIRILRSFNSSVNLPSDGFFSFISDSDPYIIVAVPAAIGVYGLARHDKAQFRNGCVLAAASILSSGITNALKYSVNRERPFITYPDITKKSSAGSPSFPSGHTSSAFATATSLSLTYSKWYVIVPSYGWAVTVGYSRMHLGVHYPSDVLAGALIGAGSAWLTHVVNKKLVKSQGNIVN